MPAIAFQRGRDPRDKLAEAISIHAGAVERYENLLASQPAIRHKIWDSQSKLHDIEQQLADAKRDEADLYRYLNGEEAADGQLAELENVVAQIHRELERHKLLERSLATEINKAEADVRVERSRKDEFLADYLAQCPQVKQLFTEYEQAVITIRTVRKIVKTLIEAGPGMPQRFYSLLNADPILDPDRFTFGEDKQLDMDRIGKWQAALQRLESDLSVELPK